MCVGLVHSAVRIFFVLAFMLLTALPVVAQSSEGTPEAAPSETPRFAIQQWEPTVDSFLSEIAEPGSSVSVRAALRTFDSVPVDLIAYVANAFSDVNGGFTFDMLGDELTAPATWVSVSDEVHHLESNDEVELEVLVNVPGEAAPGEYVVAIVGETAQPFAPEGSGSNFNFKVRTAIPLLITVPGDTVADFEMGEPAFVAGTGSVLLTIPIANTGNVRVRPAGHVTITSTEGVVVSDTPVTMGSAFPFMTTELQVVLPAQFPIGDYLISVELSDPASKVEDSFDDVPASLSEDVAGTAMFYIEPVSITAAGDPIQLAVIDITINNAGPAIPTGKVVLNVYLDGELVEPYLLSQNQAMPSGSSVISTRYLPLTGWESGSWTFEILVYSVDSAGTETLLATLPLDETIEVP